MGTSGVQQGVEDTHTARKITEEPTLCSILTALEASLRMKAFQNLKYQVNIDHRVFLYKQHTLTIHLCVH